MAKFDKLYVYKDGKPHGIIDNLDTMHIDKITRRCRLLMDEGLEPELKPIRPGDFDFDEAGAKISRIETFIYPEMGKE